MTRFSQTGKVVFFEEPVFREGAPGYSVSCPCTNVRVVKPHTPAKTAGFHGKQTALLAPILKKAVEEAGLQDYCAWFYTPMAFALVDMLAPRAVIYDCMDELSAFSYAPPQLKRREHALLKRADLVFAGGPSLYESKRPHNSATHCFPSAVDVRHFESGANSANESPLLTSLPRPRLGFFGVIDERFDHALLASIADLRPQWQFCMVGPIARIDPAILPRRANIHYYGQRAYDELPAFIAGWDLCLLLFALNDATRYISPAKTLEYLAAAHPVVTTPVTDVVELYGDLVSVARTPAEFVHACERLLDEPADAQAARQAAMRRRVERLTWDSTARAMAALLDEVIREKRPVRRSFSPLSARALPESLATTARRPLP